MSRFPRRPIAVLVCCVFAGIQVSHAATDASKRRQAKSVASQKAKPVATKKARPALSAKTRKPAPRPVATDGSKPAQARELAVMAIPPDMELRLRPERRFNVLGRKKRKMAPPRVGLPYRVDAQKGDAYPMFLVADRLEGRNDESTVATGNVEFRKLGSVVFADQLTYWPLDDEVEATGNVQVLQEGSEIRSKAFRMRLSERVGFAEQIAYHVEKEVKSKFYRPVQAVVVNAATGSNAVTGAPMMLNVPNTYGLATTAPDRRPSEGSGHAERADFEGENQIRLLSASYSTCKPGDQDWYLRASDMHLDYDQEVGNARNASVWVKDVPIFYSPLATFSLNHQRHSGFLSPSWSLSSKNGIDVALPYYWAIAPNYEVTFLPRFMAKRGFQLGAEAQYIDTYATGTTRLEYVPNDSVDDRHRYAYNIQHQQYLGRGLSAAVNWNGVSDDHYWEDMTSRLMQTTQTQLPKQLTLAYSPVPWLQTTAQVLRYQTLQPDPANPIARPYFLEPQVNVVGYKPNLLKTDFSMIAQYSNFTHPDKVDGQRFVFYPQVSLPVIHPAFQITPKLGLHVTKYNLSQQVAGEPDGLTRTLPTFTLDSTVIFERDTNWFDTAFIQTLEPRLYYVNIPYRNQSRIPVFDAGLSDFNFAQIFAENRYSGFDRVNDANQLTAALTSRVLDGTTGAERFKAMIGQRYYFKPQRTTLPGEATRAADFSNFIAAASGLVLPKTYADAAWEYNYRAGTSERFTLGARYQPELGKVMSAGYRFNSDALTGKSTVDQLDIAGQWPLASKWYAVGRYNYSLRDKQLLEAIAGVEYNAGCWAARGVVQRLEAVSGTPNTTFFFQLELNDFVSVGSNPLGLLRRSIPGYGKTNELPNSGGL